MDRLSAMALLVKVTELGSMSAAARALNMPLTTVSRHIGELENALGVRLLARTTRKLTLTDAGVDYVAPRGGSEEVENAERRDGRVSGAERRAGDLCADDVWTPARSPGDR